eukprot:3094558-Rhodomonas_salina.1
MKLVYTDHISHASLCWCSNISSTVSRRSTSSSSIQCRRGRKNSARGMHVANIFVIFVILDGFGFELLCSLWSSFLSAQSFSFVLLRSVHKSLALQRAQSGHC